MAQPARHLTSLPAPTTISPQAAIGHLRVVPRPASWVDVAVLEDASGQALALAATRRSGLVLEIALRPLVASQPKLSTYSLGTALGAFIRSACAAEEGPVCLSARDFATGREFIRTLATAGGQCSFVWRLTMALLVQSNRRTQP